MSLDWQPVVSNVENMGTNAVRSSIPNRKLKIYFRKIKLLSLFHLAEFAQTIQVSSKSAARRLFEMLQRTAERWMQGWS